MSSRVTFPSKVRRELLQQHQVLHDLIEIAADCARRTLAHEAAQGSLVESVAHIRDSLRAHNSTEETALRPLLAHVDAFGAERVERLLDHHCEEHRALVQAFEGATAPGLMPEDRANIVLATLERLHQHIEREESEELSSLVLRDDLVSVDASGG